MRVLLATPAAPPRIAGNATTAARLRDGLAALGVEVSIVEVCGEGGEDDPGRLAEALGRVRPDLLHVHQAYRAGQALLALPDGGWSLVVSLGGTELWGDLPDAARGRVVARALRRAARIVAPTAAAAATVRERLPDVAARVLVVPRGVRLGTAPFPLRDRLGFPSDAVVFFLPSGLRRVKAPDVAVEGLGPVAAADACVRLVLAGPVLEEAYAADLLRRAAALPWVRHLPGIPAEAMGAAYAASDVVLNTSHAEGMSNALLEGMAAGRAVLASDIPANREAIRDGETGLLYARGGTPGGGETADLAAKAARLAGDEELRRRLGAAARATALRDHDPGREAEAMLAVYREALGGSER
ncbi:MAG: glycosyltransferase family 4 protein [Planctomycetales bacterium]|nr:glycosyltransferase family 4 protein [Planctomycetales bacterium]